MIRGRLRHGDRNVPGPSRLLRAPSIIPGSSILWAGVKLMATAVAGPGLTIFLLNQSASMRRPLGDYGVSMAEGSANVLNLYLQRVAQNRATSPAEYASANFGVVVIGYGAGSPKPIFRMDSSSFWGDERRTHRDEAAISSDRSRSSFPIWIDTVAEAESGLHLCAALLSAQGVVREWVSSHRLAPPPRVINITDGTMDDGDPSGAAGQLAGLATSNGETTLWNCQLGGSTGEAILFPNQADAVVQLDHRLSMLFESSSLLPREMVGDLMMEFPEVSSPLRARTCIFNAGLQPLVRFVAFATRVPLP